MEGMKYMVYGNPTLRVPGPVRLGRALKDLDYAKSQPIRLTCLLLARRAEVMAGRGDAAELVQQSMLYAVLVPKTRQACSKSRLSARRASETKPTSVPETANPGGPHSFNWFPVPSHREEPGRV